MESPCATLDKNLTLSILLTNLAFVLLLYVLHFAKPRWSTPACPRPPPPQVSHPPPHEPYQDISKRLEEISNLLPHLRWIAARDSDGTNPSHADLEEVRRQVPFIALQVAA